jgi:acid phosphatase
MILTLAVLKRRHTITLAFIALLIAFSSCAHRHPLNLTLAKERVEQYHECGQYDRDMDNAVERAIKHFKRVPTCNKATVIFDIDDTVLSCYVEEKSISFGYIPERSHEWIMLANAPAIPQPKRLYDYLVKRGFHIIFLTGRKYDEYDASIKNLKDQGFTRFDKLIVRQPNELKLTAEAYKTAHRILLDREGYHIVGSVGDQWSDLKGRCSGYPVKLPNFRYLIR